MTSALSSSKTFNTATAVGRLPKGVDAFMLKPIEKHSLASTIRKVLDRHRWNHIKMDGAILSLIESRGYRYYLKTEDKLQKPFLNELPGNFDNRIVVYCKKSCLESKFEH